jgi:hypothetical protein
MFAEQEGFRLGLFVRGSTTLSGPLANVVRAGRIGLRCL